MITSIFVQKGRWELWASGSKVVQGTMPRSWPPRWLPRQAADEAYYLEWDMPEETSCCVTGHQHDWEVRTPQDFAAFVEARLLEAIRLYGPKGQATIPLNQWLARGDDR